MATQTYAYSRSFTQTHSIIFLSDNLRNTLREVIRENGRIALSILPEKNTTLMKKYARGFAPGEDAFAGMTIVTTPGGLRAMDAALAWLECKVIKECDFGADHLLVVAEVTAASTLRDGQPFVHVRGSGFHY